MFQKSPDFAMNRVLPNGSRIDCFRIIAFAGDGGTSCVYRVQDTRNGTDYALKILSAEKAAENPMFRERFIREGRLQAKIRSDFVVSIAELKETPAAGTPYFVTEYVDGPSLSDYVNSTRIPLDEALRITEETALALQAVHAQNIVHCDIKPANILLTKDHHVRLCDFGAAVDLGSDGMQECSREGTPVCVSPEQCLKNGRISPASDIYSLGVVLYLMVTRHFPFPDGKPEEVMHRVLTEAPHPPKETVPDLPDSVNELILAMLRKNPEERIPTAEAVVQRIRRIRKKAAGGNGKHIFPRVFAWSLPFLLLFLVLSYLLFSPGKRTAVSPAPAPAAAVKKTVPVAEPVEKEKAPQPEKVVKTEEKIRTPEKKSPPIVKMPVVKKIRRQIRRKQKLPKTAIVKERKLVLAPSFPASPVLSERKDVLPEKGKKAELSGKKPEKIIPAKKKNPEAPARNILLEKLKKGRKLPRFQNPSWAELFELIPLSSGIPVLYMDFPADILQKGSPLTNSGEMRPDELLEQIRKTGESCGIRFLVREKEILVYHGKNPVFRLPEIAEWVQRRQADWKKIPGRELDSAMNRIVLEHVVIRDVPPSLFFSVLARNAGLRVLRGEGCPERTVSFKESGITLSFLIREYCRKYQCQVRYQDNGTIQFYKRQLRSMR